MRSENCTDPHHRHLLAAYELGLLNREDRFALEAHILKCDKCFEDLYETAPLVHWIASKRKKHGWYSRKLNFPAFIAASLLLVLGVTFFAFFRNGFEVKRGNDYYYSSVPRITLLGPSGPVQGSHITFRWRAEGEDTYTLLIFSQEGDSIWSGKTREKSLRVAASSIRKVQKGGLYNWKVEVERDGRRKASSPVSSFIIAE